MTTQRQVRIAATGSAATAAAEALASEFLKSVDENSPEPWSSAFSVWARERELPEREARAVRVAITRARVFRSAERFRASR